MCLDPACRCLAEEGAAREGRIRPRPEGEAGMPEHGTRCSARLCLAAHARRLENIACATDTLISVDG